jgi:exosortase H (IPTLxxWG-CTERM-specific)
MLRFFLVFLAIQGVLFAAELSRPVQKAIIIPFTNSIASLSAWLIKGFDSGVVAHGNVIRDQPSGFAVAIEAGCNGVEATIVLVAAMLAMPAPWRLKLLGIGLGFLAIQAMNLLRIITLFYLGQWNDTLFEWAHLYVWQALIMLDVLIVFILWLRFIPARKAQKHAA